MSRITKSACGEQGAVALITAIIISILLAIIVTGMVTVMVSEFRQGQDAEQSIRAYYAAESGVEDAVAKLSANHQLQQPNCTNNLNLDSTNAGKVGWSCELITNSGSPTGTLDVPDQAVNIDLAGASGFAKVLVQWDQATSIPGGYFSYPATGFPPAGSAKAAALEMSVVQYPLGSFNASNTNFITQNVIFKPTTGGAGTQALSAVPSAGTVVNGGCTGVGTYHCKATITGFTPSSLGYYLRLRTRYSGTSYQLTFQTAGGSTVNVPDGTATIDVTGKAGDVYRRVIYKVPYSGGASGGLNFVLYADSDVCKNLTIINGSVTKTCP